MVSERKAKVNPESRLGERLGKGVRQCFIRFCLFLSIFQYRLATEELVEPHEHVALRTKTCYVMCACVLTSSGGSFTAFFADGERHDVASVTEGVCRLAKIAVLPHTLTVDCQNDIAWL